MRPHTCALIGVLNYLHKNNSGKEFEVRVIQSGKSDKTYKINLKRKTERKIELEVSDRWSCQAEVSVSGSRYAIDHQHTGNKYTVEEFTLHTNSITNGDHKNPTISKTFDGRITDDKRIILEDDARRIKYEVKIDSVR